VKAEFLHAWNGYRKHAWGHDDLKPLSKTHHDWYPQPLLMTNDKRFPDSSANGSTSKPEAHPIRKTW
jgi:hypothetical protein